VIGVPSDNICNHVVNYEIQDDTVVINDSDDGDDDDEKKAAGLGVDEKIEATAPKKKKKDQCRSELFKPGRKVKKGRSGAIAATTATATATEWIPKSVYPRLILFHRIKDLFRRPGFAAAIEHWRTRPRIEGTILDVYDCSMWAKYQHVDGVPILGNKYNLVFGCAIDWMQPYTHTMHSSGTIFLSIQNLPRSQRFLPCNISVAGVMPGPKEPHVVHYILQPSIEELVLLYQNGLLVHVENEIEPITIRCCLFSINCDLPAKAKVAGHSGHAAINGCAHCIQQFEHCSMSKKCIIKCSIDAVRSRDREVKEIPWPRTLIKYEKRTKDDHRAAIKRWNAAPNKTQRAAVKKDTGLSYTELIKLSYFDTIEQLTLDPLHLLYLGVAKHVMKHYVEIGVFSDLQLYKMQQFMNELIIPESHGRMAGKIGTANPKAAFADVLGAEYRHWVLHWSEGAMRNAGVAGEHLDIWLLFCHACSYMDGPVIRLVDLEHAHNLLEQFHYEFQEKYANVCVPNFHYLLHIVDSIKQFGPFPAFWNMTYEHLNGVCGKIPNNHRQIEVQYMRRMSYLSQSERLLIELHRRQPTYPIIHCTSRDRRPIGVMDYSHQQIIVHRYLNSKDVVGNGSEILPGRGLDLSKKKGQKVELANDSLMLHDLKLFYDKVKPYYKWHISNQMEVYDQYDLGGYRLTSIKRNPQRAYTYLAMQGVIYVPISLKSKDFISINCFMKRKGMKAKVKVNGQHMY
jgi:hypothetical protein